MSAHARTRTKRESVSKLRGASADNVAYATVRTAARQFRMRRLLINRTLHSSFVHIQRYIRRYPNCLRIDLRTIQILITIRLECGRQFRLSTRVDEFWFNVECFAIMQSFSTIRSLRDETYTFEPVDWLSNILLLNLFFYFLI